MKTHFLQLLSFLSLVNISSGNNPRKISRKIINTLIETATPSAKTSVTETTSYSIARFSQSNLENWSSDTVAAPTTLTGIEISHTMPSPTSTQKSYSDLQSTTMPVAAGSRYIVMLTGPPLPQ